MLLSAAVILLTAIGCADSERFAVSGKAGTLGLGGEFTAKVATDINARIGYNAYSIDFDDMDMDDVEYDAGIDLSSVSGLVDWHIFDDAFHLTGGFIQMNNEISLDGRPTGDVEIGDDTYSYADIGTLSGSAEIDGFSPYLGIGWGTPFRPNSRRWGFTIDMGVAFVDSPDVKLTASGPIASDPTFIEDLQKERENIEDDLDFIQIYPVMSLGLFFRF